MNDSERLRQLADKVQCGNKLTTDEIEYVQQCTQKLLDATKPLFAEVGKAERAVCDALAKMFENIDITKAKVVEAMANTIRKNTNSCKRCACWRGGECRLPVISSCSTDEDIITDSETVYDAVIAPILCEVERQKAECETIRQTYVSRDEFFHGQKGKIIHPEIPVDELYRRVVITEIDKNKNLAVQKTHNKNNGKSFAIPNDKQKRRYEREVLTLDEQNNPIRLNTDSLLINLVNDTKTNISINNAELLIKFERNCFAVTVLYIEDFSKEYKKEPGSIDKNPFYISKETQINKALVFVISEKTVEIIKNRLLLGEKPIVTVTLIDLDGKKYKNNFELKGVQAE